MLTHCISSQFMMLAIYHGSEEKLIRTQCNINNFTKIKLSNFCFCLTNYFCIRGSGSATFLEPAILIVKSVFGSTFLYSSIKFIRDHENEFSCTELHSANNDHTGYHVVSDLWITELASPMALLFENSHMLHKHTFS